jgi:predicted GNAT family acetyltransferase
MNPEYTSIPLVRNDGEKRFEINVNGHYAFITFTTMGKAIALNHTEVEPGLAGKGAATAVIEKTLTYIEENGFQLLPFCPMVFAYIKRHPEWKRVVSARFKGFD